MSLDRFFAKALENAKEKKVQSDAAIEMQSVIEMQNSQAKENAVNQVEASSKKPRASGRR